MSINITFHHKDGRTETIAAQENQSLMQAAKDHGVKGIEAVCGGCMACATCHVVIHPDWASRVAAEDNEKSEEEDDMLDMAFHVVDTSRLGCQIKITKALDGLQVALPSAKVDWT